MLLIDTIYINDGGGKVLLDYLIKKLELSETKCFYVFDSRIKDNHPKIKSTNRFHISPIPAYGIDFCFYRKHKDLFSKVFCFGNLPPNIGIKAEVITYYHSPLYLKTPKEFSFVEGFKYRLKRLVLKKFIKNTNHWLVQTEFIKEKLEEKFNIDSSKVSLMPFHPPFEASNNQVLREENTFLFVSNATVHKNHSRLIEAFCAFFDKYKKGKLFLTVSEDYEQVHDMIEQKISQGYPIVNVGFLNRNDLKNLYLSSQYLIFPSLAESFGLGLVEAIDNGCKVIGADLPYTYAVCEPSAVFNPYEVESIMNAFIEALNTDVEDSKSIISDEINGLFDLLK